jgi:hypothetical protein
VTFNNTDIALKPEVRFLGIYITHNLQWNGHVLLLISIFGTVSYIEKDIKGSFYPIYAMKHLLLLCQSRLRYGIIFWGGDCESNMAKKGHSNNQWSK